MIYQRESPLPLTDPRDADAQRMLHCKYSVSHHMVVKPFLLLGLADEYRSRRWCDQQLSDDHQKFMALTSELS